MNRPNTRAESELMAVATDNVATLGYWFYFSFYYASPAMLVERELRMT